MAKLFSWMKFGKKKDAVTPEPGAGSPPPQAALTPPVEEAEESMRDAGTKAAAKSTPKSTAAKPTPKKTSATPAAKPAGTTKKTSPKKK